jgi:predicted permease
MFTAVAVLTLAIGIGCATAIYSVARAVVLRPLPFADPDRTVAIWNSHPQRGDHFVELSYPAYRDWREQSKTFEQLAGMLSSNVESVMTGSGEPTALEGRWVTSSFFETLGVRPAVGRTLMPEDDRAGAEGVVVVSHRLWREHFGADPSVLGRTVIIDGHRLSVVGVMPVDFVYPKGAQFFVPIGAMAREYLDQVGVQWMIAIGRLKPGVTHELARAELTGLWARTNRPFVRTDGFSAVLTPLTDITLGPARPALLALLAAVGVLLLIACANIAALLLVQSVGRSFEFSVRRALGATSLRLSRALFAEGLALAAVGGAAGVGVACVAVPILVALSPADVPRLHEASVDSHAFLFALAVSCVAALLSSLAPIVTTYREPCELTVRQGAGRPRRSVLHTVFVVGEVGLAVVLLVVGGLVARTFIALTRVPLGFESDKVLSLTVRLPERRYPHADAVRAFYGDLLSRVRGLPGVESAAAVSQRPLAGVVGEDWPVRVQGQSAEDAAYNPLLNLEAVSSDYFRTMGIRITQGRGLTDSDVDGAEGVVVVGEALARRFWPGQNPIGQTVKVPLPNTRYHDVWLRVVGVVDDVRYRELESSRLDLYMSYLQIDHPPRYLVVRAAPSAALASAMRKTVRTLDKDLPLGELRGMSQIVSEALDAPRFAASAFGTFAAISLLLAAMGLYGLLSYSLARRTPEIGLRLALGAPPRAVAMLLLREGMALATSGVLLGLLTAAASTRLISSLLFGVQPTDPLTFACVGVLLVVVALVACAAPAWRATKIDPLTALRHE